MATINPYLNFNGNAEEAFNFYKSIFGGEFSRVVRFADLADKEGCEGMKLAENDRNKMMHIALPIGGKGDVLMASDAPEAMGKPAAGDNFSISVHAESREEAYKIFQGLSANGDIEMPLGDTFWGSYFGMCKDKFGIQWMVNYDKN